MVNYSQGKIYKVVPNGGGDDGDVYVGNTTKKYLSQRMDKHRSSYSYWKTGGGHNVTVFAIFDKYGVENCSIVLLELVNATTIDELRARERHWIQSSACVNKNIPNRTKSEYNTDNQDLIAQNKAKYHINNRERMLECMAKYHVEHREQIAQYRAQYVTDHRDHILAHSSEKIKCECGCNVRRGDILRHKKTQKHQTLCCRSESVV